RLYEIGQIHDIPVSFFFDDMAEEGRPAANPAVPGLAEEQAGFEHGPAAAAEPELPLDRRETLELVRAYYRITDPAVRKRLFDLAKALASLAPASAKPPG
ncbi:MAG TPA: hypothetical protein VFG47_14530, partial [Geminicoccaceae bacterium]|nr:hypothetical protein [Geminicoccaceae bacterium]